VNCNFTSVNQNSYTSLLDYPIEYLKGVGPQRAEALQKELSIYTYQQLLTHYPFRYVDKTQFQSVREVTEDGVYYQLRGHIIQLEIIGDKRTKRLVAKFKDASGVLELVWFQGYKWMYEKLKAENEYIIYGKATSYGGRFNMAHPDIEIVNELVLANQSAFQAVYHSTEKLKFKSLDSDGIRKAQKQLYYLLTEQSIPETLIPSIIQDFHFLSRCEAIKQIQFPDSKELLDKARYRLKFEELFFLQLKLLRNHSIRNVTIKGAVFSKVGEIFTNFYNHYLPFELTNAQKRVVKEIRIDMGSGKQMSRLVQGDVGSGLMAPTEILAKQHFITIHELVEPIGIKVALLTGSTKTKERRLLHQQLEAGDIHILIGTHALIEDIVVFKNLGLVVIDEQHSFGVAQRAKLHKKNSQPPHILIMTATPIPRTLAMTLYGDLDTSVIDELPPGRKPITTMHFMESQRLRLIGFMKQEIALGRQVYIVYPLIQESEKLDFQNLQNGYDALLDDFPPPQYQISIVHGKLKPAEKEFEMQRFIKRETQIMVATTVIEVGVNIPNASVMVIESAERFGLSQLHQLRGRVGRGADKSYCILMTSYKLGADSKLRMETMVRTNDGFEISEVDLKLRGPGDLDGTQQSGILDLKIADLAQDGQILTIARSTAQAILNEDPQLLKPENQLLVHQLDKQSRAKESWRKIG
jgi:ATP-dependent DNA helicase RecG